MILKNSGDVFEYEGVRYTVGEFIYANKNSDYEGLFGVIKEIRDGDDKDTDNDTPDIYCAFENPLIPHEASNEFAEESITRFLPRLHSHPLHRLRC